MRPSPIPIVWRLSRLARSLTQVIKTAADIHDRGIGLRVLAQNIDTTTPEAEAMLKDTKNYPFVGDVIDQLKIGRTAFYRYFPPDRIRELRGAHSEEVVLSQSLWWVMYLCLEEPNFLIFF